MKLTLRMDVYSIPLGLTLSRLLLLLCCITPSAIAGDSALLLQVCSVGLSVCLVCLSVCLLVTTVDPAKTADAIEW